MCYHTRLPLVFLGVALYYAESPQQLQALRAGLEFLLWHYSQQNIDNIQTWVYHGHNTVKELLMFSAAGLDMNAPTVQALLNWWYRYYRPDEGMFRTQEMPIPDFTRHISAIMKDFEDRYGADYWPGTAKVSAPVLRYQLYHLVEDDWLTYTLTRIALNILPDGFNS